MKWKPVAEVRVIWVLAALAFLVFAIPYTWNHFANENAADAAARDDQQRILSSLASGRADQAWISARLYLRNEHADGPSLKEVGSAFLEAGRPDEAFLTLETAFQKDGEPSTLLLMAEASLLRGNTLDAVTYADLAVSSGAGGRVGLLVLGRCLAADDRHAEAVSTFSSVLERWPADRDALRGKAESFQAIGRFAQAYDLWTNYLKFFKDPATEEEKAAALAAKSQRAVCLEGQGLEVEARAVWTSLLSEGTLNGDGSMRKAALEGLADHELENGNFSQAESLYRELMQATTETTDATVQLRLALCLHLQSRSGEVSVVLSHLLLNAPDAVVTIFTEDRFQPLRGYLIPNA